MGGARRVDEVVDASEVREHHVDSPRERLGVGHVDRQHDRAPARAHDGIPCLLEEMRSATQKADIRAGSGMADGDGTSDAAPGTGDHRDAPVRQPGQVSPV